MILENRILALIAVGASVAANCQPRLEHNLATALKSGASSLEIGEAIEVGKRVRRGAADKMDKFAERQTCEERDDHVRHLGAGVGWAGFGALDLPTAVGVLILQSAITNWCPADLFLRPTGSKGKAKRIEASR
jgi:hypothetical protein